MKIDNIMNQTFDEWIKKIPKIDLHRHLTGTITPEILQKFVNKYDEGDNESISQKISSIFNFSSSKEFFITHTKIRSYIRELVDFEFLAKSVVHQLESDNVIYSEILFSPQFFVERNFQIQEIVDVLYEVFKRSEVNVNLLIEFSRSRGKNSAEKIFKDVKPLLDSKQGQILKGISLGGDEVNYNAKQFENLFSLAKRIGLNTTAHAGEWVGSESIWEVLKNLRVERIIHGIQAIHDQDLISFLRSHQIPLDISISSNYATGAVSKNTVHPIKELYQKKIITLVSTDIPGYLNVTLSSELKYLINMGFSRTNILEIIKNTIKASFSSEEEKIKLIERINKYDPK